MDGPYLVDQRDQTAVELFDLSVVVGEVVVGFRNICPDQIAVVQHALGEMQGLPNQGFEVGFITSMLDTFSEQTIVTNVDDTYHLRLYAQDVPLSLLGCFL